MDDFNQRQFERLGDMIGEGQHLEPGGAWIAKEYRKLMKALGYTAPRKPRDVEGINKRVAAYLEKSPYSPCCSSGLKQTRSGSLRVVCEWCDKKYQLGPTK